MDKTGWPFATGAVWTSGSTAAQTVDPVLLCDGQLENCQSQRGLSLGGRVPLLFSALLIFWGSGPDQTHLSSDGGVLRESVHNH